ncbi:MAG: UpxY family transcription antiterminator [Ignavibacteriaceae bacterium]|jgi:transcription antitermination factor NusG|nr:UpxY family transcription antiterminator [Ignavibacteriaceae bacterium]
METSVGNKFWFALYTKPRQEFKAELQLKAVGLDVYLPTITRLKQWSDRKKKVTEPLINSYIFIYSSEKERLLALEQDAVIRCVFDCGRPAKIPDDQMRNFMEFIKEEEDYFVVNGIIKGAKVLIKDGPFIGVIGTIIEDPDGKALAVSIELLNRTVVARIHAVSILEVVSQKQEVNEISN